MKMRLAQPDLSTQPRSRHPFLVATLNQTLAHPKPLNPDRTLRPSHEVVAAHSASRGASGPRLPPAAMLKLLHRNMDGDWRMGR